MKSQTFKIDGQTYQVRYNSCGNDCQTCKDGGHPAYYKYAPATHGQPRGTWVYFGVSAPQPDPAHEQPRCQRDGCDNEVKRMGQKFCSARCRVAANRAK